MSTENIAWAMQQHCPSPLAKLLLLRICDSIGEDGRQTFCHIHLREFAGCDFKSYYQALADLETAGLIRNLGDVGDYDICLAMSWYKRPEPRSLPKRRLQSVARIREGLICLQGGRCWYCDRLLSECTGTPHVEHQIPLSRGGADDFSNLVMSCARCNTDKGDKTLEEYRSVVTARETMLVPAPGVTDEHGRFAGERWS